jgi:hypothetical protein
LQAAQKSSEAMRAFIVIVSVKRDRAIRTSTSTIAARRLGATKYMIVFQPPARSVFEPLTDRLRQAY